MDKISVHMENMENMELWKYSVRVATDDNCEDLPSHMPRLGGRCTVCAEQRSVNWSLSKLSCLFLCKCICHLSSDDLRVETVIKRSTSNIWQVGAVFVGWLYPAPARYISHWGAIYFSGVIKTVISL